MKIFIKTDIGSNLFSSDDLNLSDNEKDRTLIIENKEFDIDKIEILVFNNYDEVEAFYISNLFDKYKVVGINSEDNSELVELDNDDLEMFNKVCKEDVIPNNFYI